MLLNSRYHSFYSLYDVAHSSLLQLYLYWVLALLLTMQIPLQHPCLQKGNLFRLRFTNRKRRQQVQWVIEGFIREQSILIPMMNRIRNQNEWLGYCASPVMRCQVEWRSVRSCWSPGINLSVDECEAWI
jgi:hypothetical protein